MIKVILIRIVSAKGKYKKESRKEMLKKRVMEDSKKFNKKKKKGKKKMIKISNVKPNPN